jgi:hypothetical protein
MQKQKLVDILNDILHMDRDAVDRVIGAVKMRRDQLHFQNTKTFNIGDRVEFTSSRTGAVLAGTVSRVKIKYVVVNCDNGQTWNIPGGMLRPIQQKVMA